MIEATISKVKQAEAQADQVLADARQQARDIRQQADAQAKDIVEQAKKDAAAKRHQTLEGWRAEEREHLAASAQKKVDTTIPAELEGRIPAAVQAVKNVILAG